jgi:hypothetical protein
MRPVPGLQTAFVCSAFVRHAAHFHFLTKRKNPVLDEVLVVYLKGFDPLAF